MRDCQISMLASIKRIDKIRSTLLRWIGAGSPFGSCLISAVPLGYVQRRYQISVSELAAKGLCRKFQTKSRDNIQNYYIRHNNNNNNDDNDNDIIIIIIIK